VRIVLIWSLWVAASACAQQVGTPRFYNNETRGLTVDSAAVVSAHPLATQIGVDILRHGGNAVDAAIAVQFALAVCYPSAGNIGGGGFMVIRLADGETATLDFREKAPLAATRGMFLDSLGNIIEGLSLAGHLASGVPGSVAGMWEAHTRYGTIPWSELLQPAIGLATTGVELTEKEAQKLNRSAMVIRSYSSASVAFVRSYDGGRTGFWADGAMLRQPELARTLTAIRDSGAGVFYSGWIADSIVAEMQHGGGLIKHEDLNQYKAIWREPLEWDFGNYHFISMGPPSSGGVCLAQMLGMIEGRQLGEWNETPMVHLMTEVERRAYADRAQHLGDADFYDVPMERLLDSGYLAERMSSFDPDNATPSSSLGPGDMPHEGEETTHFSIVDQYGNAVAVTTTLNGSFGSHVVVGGCGFLLNNQMDDFSIKPGVPNLYGLVGADANAIEPGKRMLSSMTPTIIEKDGRLWMVVGTPGGSTIITSVLQTFLNVAEFGMTMPEAVSALKFHHQWLPDRIDYEEPALDEKTITRLTDMGHTLHLREPIGRIDAILVTPDGKLECGADPRGDDACAGF
jgi:gamma-glutamyltranspeptidase/glutathione hydrolase